MISSFDEVFSNSINSKQIDNKNLNDNARSYFLNISKILSIYFDENDMRDFIEQIDEIFNQDFKKNIFKMIAESGLNTKYKREFDFDENKTCFYCRMSKSNEILEDYSIEDKLKNKYGQFSYNFSIDADSSKIHLALDRKFTRNFSNLRTISLHNCSLEFDKNGDDFFNRLNNIIEISLENNQMDYLPDSISKVTNLRSLRIVNPIKSLSDYNIFHNMEYLQNLELDETEFLKYRQNFNERKIKLSGNLKQLKIRDFQLNILPFDFDNDSQLISLEIPGVPWLDIDQFEKTSTFITINTLKTLYEKTFTQDQILKLFRHFDHDSNGYFNREETAKFNAFVFKKFSRLGDNIEEIQSGIPETIFKLNFIKYLDLSYQAIRQIPEEIANLENLNVLILKDCVLLNSISPKLSLLPITSLNLENCYSLKTPPPEIVKRGMSSVISYLKRLNSGSILCQKTKLMFVRFFF